MHVRAEQSQLTTQLFTLFIRCPFGHAVSDCPFADIRALQSLELKFRLAEQMARHPQCPENVRNTHGVCYRERLQAIRSAPENNHTARNTTESNLGASSRGGTTLAKKRPWLQLFHARPAHP